jgi:hypothetical protein
MQEKSESSAKAVDPVEDVDHLALSYGGTVLTFVGNALERLLRK